MQLKFSTKSLVIFLSLFTSFIPMSFYYIDTLAIFLPFIRLLRFLFLIFFLFCIICSHKCSKRFLKLSLFILLLLISTIINRGELTNYIDNISCILLIVCLVEYFYYSSNRILINKFLLTTYIYFFILIIINFISIFIYSNGVYRVVYQKDFWGSLSYPVYFLQTENRLIEFILPLLLFTFICYERHLINKTFFVLSITICIVTSFLTGSATTMVGVVTFFVVGIILIKFDFNLRTLMIVCLILILIQVIFESIMNQPLILFAVSYIFGRTETILSRFQLGNQAIELFKNQPIFGYGTADVGRYFVEGSVTYWVHNHVWDILVQGGIIGLLSFITYLFPIRPRRIPTKRVSKVDRYIYAAMISVLIMGCTESFVYAMEFYIIAAMFDFKRLCISKEE